ncbi:VWA domain-containing protein [Allorhizocola rhizosphaerae]|uniref:VWA domain-containing protein n=1 Tax=Allorhizocola rhizosphaerae TaxID=1872709 RepID=UPI000E3DC48A|nr:VWA domain-containing protein [Allorhizocola rhizosphaerae]
MSFLNPLMIAVAVIVFGAALTAYLMMNKRRSAAITATGLGMTGTPRRAAMRRHLPYALFLAALPLLLLALARPQATINVPRIAGTVMLVFDVSNSMAADDVKPSRLAAAQAAGTSFVQAQPDTVDIGVVAFGQGALMTQKPTNTHDDAVNAIKRLQPGGGTSLGQAILASLSAIVGKPVNLPEEGAPPQDLGYWGSATIVLFSDGEETGGPDVESAALLAADAGVRIETVGIGTPDGATVEVDGYQMATALNEEMLTAISGTTGGTYHRGQDAASLNEISQSIDLKITAREEQAELTGLLGGAALLLLTIGGLLMARWHGRIV